MKQHLPWLVGGLICAAATPLLHADEKDDRIRALEKQVEGQNARLQKLEERLAAQAVQDATGPKSSAMPLVSVGANGFVMQSANSNFVLKLKGVLQMDSRSYTDDGGIKNNDTFLIRRARPILEGTLFRDFDFRLQLDFGGPGAPTLRDAYVNYRYSDEFQLRFGKFKTPVGLEQLTSDSSTMFIERSLVSGITPSRDVGVQFHGHALDGLVNYAAGVFNGLGDGRASSNVDTDDEKSFAGRIVVFPFQHIGVRPIQRLGLGVGSSFARPEGAGSLPAGNGFITEGQQQFFTYRTSALAGQPNVVADGDHWRVSPQASWYYGRWRAIAEYVLSSQQLRRTDTGLLRALHNRAWQVAAGCVLTGEDALENGVVPRKNFNPTENAWGAFEIIARYSSLDVDDEAFPRFANPETSASEATAWAVGFNWYLNKNIRAAANFIQTDFRGGRGGAVTAQDEKVFLTRIQLSF